MYIEALVVAFFLGLIPAIIARNKGYNFYGWWFFGFIFFIIAFPASLIIQKNNLAIERSKLRQGMKKCPFCAEFIKNEAIVCRFCGRSILQDLPSPPSLPHKLEPECIVNARQYIKDEPNASTLIESETSKAEIVSPKLNNKVFLSFNTLLTEFSTVILCIIVFAAPFTFLYLKHQKEEDSINKNADKALDILGQHLHTATVLLTLSEKDKLEFKQRVNKIAKAEDIDKNTEDAKIRILEIENSIIKDYCPQID